ncbi:DeoR-like helix-turn-helix domain-containing protein [Ruminococcaceae bacterium YRB3002]|nr:DeoR-like helix-turn-helix domain-containing protein [Ruminococcaceae bacterium YRB3002]
MPMQDLIRLLKDGKSRSVGMIAAELGMSVEQVQRDIEFLEQNGIIRRIEFSMCGDCSGCSGSSSGEDRKTCPGCTPEGGFKNMGVMWEIV